MKKLLLALVLQIFCFSDTFSQNIKWANKGGGTENDHAKGVVTDAQGNVYVTGKFRNSSASFGSVNVTSYGSDDIFLSKYNKNGVLQWVRTAGGSSSDWGHTVAIDNAGNVYVGGWFSSSIQFGSSVSLSATGSDDGFIAKYKSNGDIVWARKVGGANLEYVNELAIYNNKLYVLGHFSSSNVLVLNQTLSNGGAAGSYDVFVARVDTAGNLESAFKIGGASNENAATIDFDKSGNILLGAYFQGSTTIGVNTYTSAGSWDILFIKTNQSGTVLWSFAAGGAGGTGESIQGISVDENNNYYFTGPFYGSFNFGSTQCASNGDADTYVAKFDSAGNFKWVKTFGSSAGYDTPWSLEYRNGRVYSIGQFGGAMQLSGSSTLTPAGLDDMFIICYDTSGNYKFGLNFGGVSNDVAYNAVTDNSGNFILVGYFTGSPYFGSSQLASAGVSDMVVLKINLIADEPTQNATGMQFTSVGKDSLSVSWTNGNGNARVVVARKDSAVTSYPEDRTVYQANNQFGQGSNLGNGNFVVYSGTGSSLNLKNLTPNSVYHLSVFEYNGSNDSINYLSSSALSGNKITMPSASITPDSGKFCAGDSLLLTLTPQAGCSYQWKHNGNVISGATSLQYYAKQAGSYRAEVSNASGTTASSNIAASSIALPSSSIVPSGNISICQGDSTQFTASLGSAYSYMWYRDGSALTATTPTIVAKTAGIYKVKVTEGICSLISGPVSLIVNSLPQAVISALGNTTFCEGNSVTLKADTANGYAYQWQAGSSNISNAISNQLTVSATGSYRVKITSAANCISYSSPLAVTVHMLPQTSINLSGTSAFCLGDSRTLTASSGNGYTYEWLKDNVSLNHVFKSISVTAAGTYKVRITDANGCDNSSSVQMTVNNLPSSTMTANGNTTFCSGDSVELSANSGTAYSYEWYKNNVFTGLSNQSVYVSNGGDYKVKVIDSNLCSSLSNITSVSVLNRPGKPTVVNSGNTLSSTLANAYQWFLNGAVMNGVTSRTITPPQNGNYSVQIEDANGCRNMSDPFNFVATGINRISAPGVLNVFPNPAKRFVKIQTAETLHQVTVEILTLNGSLKHKVHYDQLTEASIQLDGFAQGIYMIRITSKDAVQVSRLSVE